MPPRRLARLAQALAVPVGRRRLVCCALVLCCALPTADGVDVVGSSATDALPYVRTDPVLRTLAHSLRVFVY